ncbi:MAG: hypothetical protein GX793_00460 [Bacteroidales bacterium]|jgi:hypothetical protein|nr:hypothetical protein [Bacteroidales bacterium]NLB85513.1 hypothetical protein [Bacteroidales bacterium]
MKRIKIIFVIGLIISLLSCESNEQKINKAKEVVQSFVTNLSFDNYDEMFKLYPSFKNVQTYWRITNFNIKNSVLNENTIILTGTFNELEILFEVEKIDGKYIITKSKGLSSEYNSNLYEYCKNIGCLGTNSYDADISKTCKENEFQFNRIVKKIKGDIEDNVWMINHTVTKSYNWVSGDITIKNSSRYTIPGYSYILYVNYFDRKGNLLFTSKYNFNFESIPYGQSKTIHVYESNSNSFQKVDISIEIIDTDFIEQIIGKYAEGYNCTYSYNL